METKKGAEHVEVEQGTKHSRSSSKKDLKDKGGAGSNGAEMAQPRSMKKTVSFSMAPFEGDFVTHVHVSLAALVNEKMHSDVHFLINFEQAKVYGHACVIEARCPGILTQSPSKRKKNITEVEAPLMITCAAFVHLMEYIYTGNVNFEKLSVVAVVRLLAAAAHYEGTERLKWTCEYTLKKRLDLSTVYEMLIELEKFSTLVKYMKNFCLRYAVDNYNEFVTNKELVHELGVELFQEVLELFQQHAEGELKPLANSLPPKSTFIKDMQTLYQLKKGTDINFKIVTPNMYGISGTIYPAHKAIVAARAPGLRTVINQAGSGSKGMQPQVSLKGITSESFEALLKWIYYGESRLPMLPACELVGLCNDYKMVDLQGVCTEVMLKKRPRKDTVLTILDTTYLVGMPDFFQKAIPEIRKKCFAYIYKHAGEIKYDEIREKKLQPTMAIDIVLQLQRREKKKVKKLQPRKAKGADSSPASASPPASPVWARVRAPSAIAVPLRKSFLRQNSFVREKEESSESSGDDPEIDSAESEDEGDDLHITDKQEAPQQPKEEVTQQ